MSTSKEFRQIFLVVLEPGAVWPQELDYRGLTDVHVVARHVTELQPAFASRMYARVARLSREGGRIAAAALVLNERFSSFELTRRYTVARILTSPLMQSVPSELVIHAPLANVEWEAHLGELSERLSDGISNVPISIELGSPLRPLAKTARTSGFFARGSGAPRRDRETG